MSRFVCPSASLSLKLLLKRMRRAIWMGVAVSMAIHLSFTAWSGLAEEERMAKPLTTQFIKRQPRLTKPLELKKRPRPKRRQIRREMVSVRARADRHDVSSSVLPMQLVESLARPQVNVGRITRFQDIVLEPATVAQAISGTMKAKEAVNMSLEMIDLESLDTGKYHAMVIQDPNDKRNVRGFFHLAIVHIHSLAMLAGTNCNRSDAAIAKLIQAVNEYTDIKADVKYRCDFDSQELFKTPWIYAGAWQPFQLTESELDNLGKYLVSGGFLFGEEWIWVRYNSFEGSEKAFANMYKGALATQGYERDRDWVFERVPSEHPIFHCFFDFQDIPTGYTWSAISEYPQYIQSGLMGVTIGNRLAATFDHKSIMAAWYGKGWSGAGSTDQMAQQRRAVQFGINTIVFALTQEGSITHRVMEEVQ